MSDAQLAKAPAPNLHFPTVLGAVVITYDLAGLSSPLKLTGPAIADIYLGKISQWNDPALAGTQSWRHPSRPAHCGVPSIRRQRNLIHLYRLPFQGQRGLAKETGQGDFGQMAEWPGWQGQRGSHGSSAANSR